MVVDGKWIFSQGFKNCMYEEEDETAFVTKTRLHLLPSGIQCWKILM